MVIALMGVHGGVNFVVCVGVVIVVGVVVVVVVVGGGVVVVAAVQSSPLISQSCLNLPQSKLLAVKSE